MPQTPDAHTPPAADELELSLFGPGIGECVVLHIGGGEWVIVDSCIDRVTRRPVALDYLAELGVDVAAAVKLVVITHWHDDHIQGASRLLREARSTAVSCSAALNSRDFLEMVAGAPSTLMESPGVGEFREILKIVEDRAPHPARLGSAAPRLAKENTRLLRRESSAAACAAEVHALSPSDGALRLSWREIAQSFPQLGQPKRRAVALSPNQVAVALWVVVGEARLLLGSDLEESGSETLGWRAIINSATRPPGRAQVFKVPHHGSGNAHSEAVWQQMLVDKPHALLTPFAAGGTFLPTDADITRLLAQTADLYCTARPGGTSPSRRSSAVEKMASQVARNRRVIRGETGHVRVRTHVGGSPLEVHCCKGAYRAS